MSRLKYLNVAWNQLSDIHSDVMSLCNNTVNLKTLDLRHNPWQKVCSLFIIHFCNEQQACLWCCI